MKKKYYILALMFIITVFIALTGTMMIEGVDVNASEDEYSVYYSKAVANGEKELDIKKHGTSISFDADFGDLKEDYTLEYDVTNSSKLYNLELDMICNDKSDYLEITNDFDTKQSLKALETRSGKLVLKVKKGLKIKEDVKVSIKCSIVETNKQKVANY